SARGVQTVVHRGGVLIELPASNTTTQHRPSEAVDSWWQKTICEGRSTTSSRVLPQGRYLISLQRVGPSRVTERSGRSRVNRSAYFVMTAPRSFVRRSSR